MSVAGIIKARGETWLNLTIAKQFKGLLCDGVLSVDPSVQLTSGEILQRIAEPDRHYLVAGISNCTKYIDACLLEARHLADIIRSSEARPWRTSEDPQGEPIIVAQGVPLHLEKTTEALRTTPDMLGVDFRRTWITSASYDVQPGDHLQLQGRKSLQRVVVVEDVPGTNLLQVITES
jgi:hypothetical protein